MQVKWWSSMVSTPIDVVEFVEFIFTKCPALALQPFFLSCITPMRIISQAPRHKKPVAKGTHISIQNFWPRVWAPVFFGLGALVIG